jgi:regulator of protease activity HflC (stomatin/prohibitin superfamily)
MMPLDLWVVFLILVVIALPALAVRVAPEHHRFAVLVGGKYAGLKGPGILVRMPVPGAKWLRLRIGDRVDVISTNLAKVGNFHVPVTVESGDAGTVMRIKAFQGNSIVVGAE